MQFKKKIMKKMAIAINFSLLSTFQDLKMFTSLKKNTISKVF